MPGEFIDGEDMKLGDVLFFVDEAATRTVTHLAITAGQAAVRPTNRDADGFNNVVHVVIWTKGVDDQGGQIAEASGGASVVRSTELRKGTYFHYSCINEELGERAAGIATTWALPERIRYNRIMCMQSVFHSASFGPNAQKRAEEYAKGANTNAPTWGQDGSFCSQFVVAAYQAAAGMLGIPMASWTGLLATDAIHCSVKTLQQKIRNDDRFEYKGEFSHGLFGT